MLGHFCRKREDVERLSPELERSSLGLGDIAELLDDFHETRARFLSFVDHFALSLVQRGIALEHPEIAADHAGRRPEFVDREREKTGIAFA